MVNFNSIPDEFSCSILKVELPKLWLRPKRWEENFCNMQKEIAQIIDDDSLEPVTSCQPGSLCLIKHTNEFQRGVVVSCDKLKKCTILLVDSRMLLNDIPRDVMFEMPGNIGAYPKFCIEVSVVGARRIMQRPGCGPVLSSLLTSLHSAICKVVDKKMEVIYVNLFDDEGRRVFDLLNCLYEKLKSSFSDK